jgi:hypothetical protein
MATPYRATLNAVGTDEALRLAYDLEHWEGPMRAHRESVARLGFAPDGHPSWTDCPHAEARRLWARAVGQLGDKARAFVFLLQCATPSAA